MEIEHYSNTRTWFVTLTYRHVRDYSYKSVQDWLKRLRNNTGAYIRYIATEEFESRGRRKWNPHHHLLVHGPRSIKYRDLAQRWRNINGFVDFSLVRDAKMDHYGKTFKNPHHVYAYLAKYLLKSSGRVRASSGYGKSEFFLGYPTKHWQVLLDDQLDLDEAPF